MVTSHIGAGDKLTLLWPQVWWRSIQLLKTQQWRLKIITYQDKENKLEPVDLCSYCNHEGRTVGDEYKNDIVDASGKMMLQRFLRANIPLHQKEPPQASDELGTK